MDYPKSDVYERAYIIKLFHNEKLHNDLDKISPSVFLDTKKRLIIYIMKRLREAKLALNISNISLFMSNPDEHLLAFIRKSFRVKTGYESRYLISESEVYDILFDNTTDSSEGFFEVAREEMLNQSFVRFVMKMIDEIQDYNSYNRKENHPKILARTKAINTVYNLMFNPDVNNVDQLKKMQSLVNSDEEYITTSSSLLNSYIGGFTRSYVDAIIGKSSHAKSTWTDYNILHTVLANKVDKIVKITTEEPPEFSWRRIASIICHLSTTMMRQKLQKITDVHVKLISEKLNDRYKILNGSNKYKDILEMIRVVKADQIYVDHIQSIDYPGSGGQLNNMIANIPGLILFEEKIAQQRNMSIVNLSQVGDKEIARSDRMSKRPRYHDAYGSSILYQKAREFLAVYYPYKDYDENPHTFYGTAPTINDFEIGIEKSSFSAIGVIKMGFDPEFCTFSDKPTARLKTDYIAPKEQTNMFEN